MEKEVITARLEARLPAEIHAMLKRAAEIIRPSAEDQRLIAATILNPPEPTPALRRAFQRRHEFFGPA